MYFEYNVTQPKNTGRNVSGNRYPIDVMQLACFVVVAGAIFGENFRATLGTSLLRKRQTSETKL